MITSESWPHWRTYLDILARAESALDRLADPSDPRARQEAHRLLFAAIAAGYQTTFTDPDLPDFVPMVSNVLNVMGANPDFIYGYTRIDGHGVYRLSGQKGNAVFILVDFAAGGLGVMDDLGPSVGTLDLDKFTLGPNGEFEVLLSAERPSGYTGDWFPLDRRATTASLRRAYYDWGEGADTRIAIDRIDQPLRRVQLDTAEIARRLERLAQFAERFADFALGYGQRQRAEGYINRLEHDDWAGRGGVAGQHYYQGLFSLQPGEAMIIETDLPERVRYWNVQLNDTLWNTVDWVNHQSSLNGAQARLDSDGKFRAVIAVDDPGVPNWLDPAGSLEGSLMLRWTEASSGPAPQLTIVPSAEVRKHLPADTPVVSPEQRQELLLQRRRGAQWRHRW